MTDEKKKDDKDRKKLSDEELEDVAGGKGTDWTAGGSETAWSVEGRKAPPSGAKKRADEPRR